MRARVRIAIAALAVSALTCTEPTGPVFVRPANAVDVIVDFCTFAPSWILVKNDSAEWSSLPVLSGFFSRWQVAVTPKVAIAWGRNTPGSPFSSINVMYLTADELATMNCGPARGDKLAYAPVAGLQSNQSVIAFLGPALGSFFQPSSTNRMSIFGVPAGPQDLVAYTSGSTTKYIVRHDLNIPLFDTTATLDFASAEAVVASPFQMTVPGTTVFTSASLSSAFMTNNGTAASLVGYGYAVNDTGSVKLLPASVLKPGDGFAVSASSGNKLVTRYIATPGPQTLTFGPDIELPTIATIDSSPVLRMRASFPSQPEYPSLAAATFLQGTSSQIRISVAMTAGYLGGTPAMWTLDVPDFGGIIPPSLLLTSGTTVTFSTSVWDARVPLYFSKFGANDGEVVRCASTGGSSTCKSPIALF